MKELTEKEKAQRYDEAIERAKSKIKNDKDHVLYEDDIIELFPELGESKDENIIKEMKDFFSRIMLGQENFLKRDYDWMNWISWLEKQQKHIEDRYMKVYLNGTNDALKTLKSYAWSDEDEQYLLVCKNALAKYQASDKWDAEIISRWLENRLKAHQNRWKPTKRQLLELSCAISGCSFNTSILVELEKDLKKLMEK